MQVDMASSDFRAGLWSCSCDEENWSWLEFFETRDEAIIAYDKENGELPKFVGQIEIMTDDEVVSAVLRDQDDANDYLAHQDEWAWVEDDLLEIPHPAMSELKQLVGDWVRRNNINPKRWHTMSCKVTDDMVPEQLRDQQLPS